MLHLPSLYSRYAYRPHVKYSWQDLQRCKACKIWGSKAAVLSINSEDQLNPYLTQSCIDFQGHKIISTRHTYVHNCSSSTSLVSCPVNVNFRNSIMPHMHHKKTKNAALFQNGEQKLLSKLESKMSKYVRHCKLQSTWQVEKQT